MTANKTTVPFRGTAEQEARLLQVIETLKAQPGALMPILQQAQEIYGYLPKEVQVIVARGLELPLEEVYGVVTFYSQFSLYPKGQHQISVCLGTACYVKGAKEIYDRIAELLSIGEGEVTADGKFSLNSCRCIGACGLAPVMMIGEDVYGRLTPAEVDGILKKY
ncbi:MAG: NAD(P)H-dependent oxidoreductase subunit E [Firmicutes bacterium]|nr:NAD(P)H-dependent oxidoreductase subunit E [Bacillota bacterium]